jgi:hypothetical protein
LLASPGSLGGAQILRKIYGESKIPYNPNEEAAYLHWV